MNTNNKVQLTGNLGAAPEVKIFESGNKLVRFSIAVSNEIVLRSGERKSNTQWHLVAAWGKAAEKAETELSKGSFVSIEGRLESRSYTDKNGQKKYITEVVAHDITLIQKAA